MIRHPRLLVYIAMADAYGMGAEYLKPTDGDTQREVMKFERYVRHPRHSSGAGKYTDDTEMSIANAHVLLECDPPYSKLDFADAYVKEFAFGGRRLGYSQGFQAVLEKVKSGEELLATVKPDSEKNGAAMRAMPFGLLRDVDRVQDAATVSANVTHATDVGRFSARAVALATHFALYSDKPLTGVREYLREHLWPGDMARYYDAVMKPWPGGPVIGGALGTVGITTVMAALTLVERERSLVSMLLRACDWGGDVDSVAAITWGIASARYQDEVLPDFLERDLEFGSPRTGVERLTQIGEALMKKFG